MDIVAYSQYYRTRTPERQLEIDECLRRNLNHPGLSRMVLFCESDAPPVPQGTGTPLQSSLHFDDLAETCVFDLEHWQPPPEKFSHLNVGTRMNLNICAVAELAAKCVGYASKPHWDVSKPEGTLKRQINASRLAELRWPARIALETGVSQTIENYIANIVQP